jgi:ABC-type lipoprotein release transport system permease subunit
VTAAASLAIANLRRHRGQWLLTWAGVAAVSAMIGAAVTAGDGLRNGFDRAAARSDLPDVIATFDERDLADVRERVRALPNLVAASFRLRERRVEVSNGGRRLTSGQLEGVRPGRRGYAVVAGRDLTGAAGEAVIERGLAREWHIGPGDRITIDTLSGPRAASVVGVAVSPDNVAYPLASEARIWMPYAAVRHGFAPSGAEPVDEVLLWVRDRSELAVTLEQARAASFGVGGLVFVTRAGVKVFVDQAAGIVIALLVGFSAVALAAAAVMLVAAARVDAQRRLEVHAAMRALGASRRWLVTAVALEKATLAAPAAAVGMAAGWAAAHGPTGRLLETLDQFPSGWSVLPPLFVAAMAVVAVVTAVTAWPVWRASTQEIAPMLRAAELGATPRGRGLPAGSAGLGMRMVVSRPVRTLATSAVLAASGGIVLLMLALAGLLDALQHDPGVVGKRYQLTTRGSPSAVARAESLPGVAAAARRFRFDAADAYDLGQAFQIIAYCGDRLRFEAPQLRSGRRATARGEAEVGRGLATALGLHPGSPLVAVFPDGDEARFRVSGVVDALDNDGRIAYVEPSRAICAFHGGITVIQLAAGANAASVAAALRQTGRPAQTVGGVTSRNASFLGVLAALLRTIAVLDGVVCAYVITQMMLLTASERRSAVAVLRACGAGPAQVAAVFAGVALPAAALAAPVAVVLEWAVLGPAVSGLAASYVSLSVRAGGADVALMIAGLAVITVGSAAAVARHAGRESILRALRDY